MNGTTKQYTALYITDSDDHVTALKKMNLAYSATQRLVFHFRIYQLGYHGSLWL